MSTLLPPIRSDRPVTRPWVPLLAALCIGLVVACGPAPEEQTIDRETFIQTYVDLRVAALDTDTQRLAEPDREAILTRHGVTAEDLMRFAQVHAPELEYMRDVWNEIELRLDRTPPSSEATDAPSR